VYKHKLDDTLSIAASFDSPAVQPRGMFGYKNELFIIDSQANRIVKVNPESFSITGMYTLPAFEKGTNRMASMAWDGRSIWSCSDGVKQLFRNKMKSLKPIKF